MKLEKLVTRKDIYIFPWYISDLLLTKKTKVFLNSFVNKIFVYIKNGCFEYYLDKKSVNKLGESFLTKIIEDYDFIQLVTNKIYLKSDELLSFIDTVPTEKECRSLSNEDLITFCNEYTKRLSNLRIWGWIPPLLDGSFVSHLSDYISKKFKEHLNQIDSINKFPELYAIMTSSEKESEVQREEISRLKVLLDIKKLSDGDVALKFIKKGLIEKIKSEFPKTYILIKKHIKEYSWLTYAYQGPAMNVVDAITLMKKNLEENNTIEEQLLALENRSDKLKNDKKNIIKKYKLPDELLYLFNVSTEFMYIKDYRKGIYQKSYLKMDNIMGEIASRLCVSQKEIKFLTFDEISKALTSERERTILVQKVKKRIELVCYICEDGKIKIYEGEVCNKIKQDLVIEDKITEVNELKGMVAYPGHAFGKVKIILTKEDLFKMEKGDILISSSTNPDLISAMKWASAIVTDMGGITSHAAIVSRELKTPCIVGTKIATEVLKDGMEVEVDANNAVVRIIK